MENYRGTPVQVKELTGATGVAAGDFHTRILKRDGTVWCWGSNGWGQLGDGTTGMKTTPVQVKGLTGATGVAARHLHTRTLKNGGAVWGWGDND